MGDSIQGGAKDKQTNETLSDVKVVMYDNEGEIVDSLRSNGNGKFIFDADNGSEYKLVVRKRVTLMIPLSSDNRHC